MKNPWISLALTLAASVALADSPDSSFIKNAAEGGMSEVELGQLAPTKGNQPCGERLWCNDGDRPYGRQREAKNRCRFKTSDLTGQSKFDAESIEKETRYDVR